MPITHRMVLEHEIRSLESDAASLRGKMRAIVVGDVMDMHDEIIEIRNRIAEKQTELASLGDKDDL